MNCSDFICGINAYILNLQCVCPDGYHGDPHIECKNMYKEIFLGCIFLFFVLPPYCYIIHLNRKQQTEINNIPPPYSVNSE